MRRMHPDTITGPGHRRPFLVGLVHGLAGSGALMLAVAATITDPTLAIAYVLIFGVGSIGGMAITSTLFAIPMVVTTRRFTGGDALGLRRRRRRERPRRPRARVDDRPRGRLLRVIA
jgi:hypothetical protein